MANEIVGHAGRSVPADPASRWWERRQRERRGSYDAKSARIQNVEQFLDKVDRSAAMSLVAIIICIIILSVAAAMKDGFSGREFFSAFGLLLILAIGAATAGGMLGFLFGIPRNLQVQSVVAPDADGSQQQGRRTFFGNTNLEEISDWLTKIIVGVGLIQATAIYAEMKSLANTFEGSILSNLPGSGSAFLSIVVAAAVCGFLLIYLETRTRLTLLLAEADNIVGDVQMPASNLRDKVISNDIVITAADTDSAQYLHSRSQTAPAGPGDESFLRLNYHDLKTAGDFAAWGAAQARAGNLEAAERGMQGAVALDPGNVEYMIKLADIRQQQGRFQLSISVLKEALDKSKNKDSQRILRRILYNSLYIPQPLGFQLAKPAIDELSQGAGSRSAVVHLWIAAEYGQRYEWLANNSGHPDKQKDARDRALAAVRKVIELSPNPADAVRVTLRQIFDPEQEESAPNENDLEVFKDDKEFIDLIYGSATNP